MFCHIGDFDLLKDIIYIICFSSLFYLTVGGFKYLDFSLSPIIDGMNVLKLERGAYCTFKLHAMIEKLNVGITSNLTFNT